jgi:hypothetical protein
VDAGQEISRRQVLRLLGGSTAWVALGSALPQLALPRAPARVVDGGTPENIPTPTTNPVVPQPGPPQLTLTAPVFRREDTLMLVFYGYNLVLSTGGGTPVLARADARQEAYLVVQFPPQAVLEAAVPVGATPPATWPSPPLPALLAGPSRLAFLIPAGTTSIPFTLDALLEWSGWTFQWESSPFTGTQPPDLASYIEAPARLMLSPDGTASWSHSSAPLTYGGRTELWQTRLGAGGTEPPASSPPLRAVWTPGYPQGLSDPFTPTYEPSLHAGDRLDIIALTCGTTGSNGPSTLALPSLPSVPAHADLFMLTSLGATLNVHGSWSSSSSISLTDWHHRMFTGRESYVRTVRAGYLFPFGHRAVFITITDREFQADGSGDTLAYLVQRQYVAVVQTTRNYAGSAAEPYSGRQNPLRQVTVTTLATPPLDPMSSDAEVGNFPGSDTGQDDMVFWVRVNNADYPFAHTAVDVEGRSAHFEAGAIFVSEAVALDNSSAAQVRDEYATASSSRRSPSFSGQLLAFADPGQQPGSTAQHVDSLQLGGSLAQVQPAPGEPWFFPYTAAANLRLPGAEALAGSPLGSIPFVISPNYYQANFKSGVAEVFLELAQGSQPTPLSFPPQHSGGIATPNMGITGLARDLGPVAGDLQALLAGQFDPKAFFAQVGSQVEAKLLGAISLWEIVAPAGLPKSPPGASATGQAPAIQSALVYPNNDPSQPPDALRTTLDWSPIVNGDSAGFFVPGNGSQLAVHAELYTPIKSPQQTTYSIKGNLSGFDLVLFGNASRDIEIHFNGLSFSFSTGAKTQISPDIAGVTFEGPLSFVQTFEQFFASLGGPTINVGAAGIEASYSVALPSVSAGVFSLSNLALSGKLNIPFDSSPVRLRVDFCSRENPFLLAVDLFTGGGFFGVSLGADGIELLEVSLEFGASASVNLGVASGGVSIMAGIYFALQTTPSNSVQLTGFLRADGNLSVLGIINISMEFYLGLAYLDPRQVYGTATVTVEVSVLCFSESVSVTMTKTIGGGDPTFSQAITQGDWHEYCLAFAEQ